MMNEPSRINDLADELLGLILSFLIADANFSDGREAMRNYAFPPYDNNNNNNKRNGTNTIVSRGERTDLDRYRLVCRRFMRIATPCKFRRFSLRYSADGFRRLNELVDMQQAHHTRFFTYMVRPCYQGRDWERFLAEIARDDPKLSEIHAARFADQTSLIKNARDFHSLRRALIAFSSLQQIKLLRLQDWADEEIMKRARGRDVKLDWELACSRAIEGLSLALVGSSCQSVRFLGPQLSPEAALRLLNVPRVTMSALGERLTCLDIYFHSASDVTAVMSKLSATFREFFQAARNLVTLNVGFPADSPLNLHLEDVFHHIHWPRLRSLGIQGWRLHSSEICAIARRHQSQLRELRLPYVYLLDGSRWRDVLSILHDEMERLENLNLQHIDYASHFNTEMMHGIEIPPGSTTDEDEQREDNDNDNEMNHNGQHDQPQSDTDSSSILSIRDSQSEVSSELDESYRPQHRYAYQHHNQHQRDLQSLTEHELSMLTVNDLGDNGIQYDVSSHPIKCANCTDQTSDNQPIMPPSSYPTDSTMTTTIPSTPDSNINHASSLAYWNNIPPTVNGMLGGFPQVSRIDLRGSASFLAKIRRLLLSLNIENQQDQGIVDGAGAHDEQQQQRRSKKLKRGVDCGAGIGRVTEGFLRNVCETVDVVEPVAKFAEVIRQGSLVRRRTTMTTTTTKGTTKVDQEEEQEGEKGGEEVEEGGVVENIYITGLEDWTPVHKYDLIWIQWCVGHLTDSQLKSFLRRAADALTSNGFIVVKENNSTDPEGKDLYDEVDSSVTRTDESFRRLFKEAGLNLVKAEEQLGFPRHLGLLPVKSYALRPVRIS